MNIRTGFGVDTHQLKEGFELTIGGLTIPHNKGSVGHSDADVLIHSICDALLGAANLGDIGTDSLEFGKIITTGEGGLITTNNKKIDKICREYHDHGHENNPKLPRGRDTKSKPGFNYRMTEIQGTIGLGKLGVLSGYLNFEGYSDTKGKIEVVKKTRNGEQVAEELKFTSMTEK